MRSQLLVMAVAISVHSIALGENLLVNFGDQIPDFVQTEVGNAGKNGGAQYCAPAAVSNSLMWLASQEHPTLVDPKTNQRKLVLTLASSTYFDTDKNNGTPPRILLTGLERYLKDRGINHFSLKFHGIGPHPKRFSLGTDLPSPTTIVGTNLRQSAVWLNIGWLKAQGDRSYQRIGAHWVTVVGYQPMAKDKYVIAIHNPSPKSGKTKTTDFIELEPIILQRLVDRNGNVIKGATNGFRVKGLPSERGDAAILAGVVKLEL